MGYTTYQLVQDFFYPQYHSRILGKSGFASFIASFLAGELEPLKIYNPVDWLHPILSFPQQSGPSYKLIHSPTNYDLFP